MSINGNLLTLLACPSCKDKVVENGNWLVCQNSSCGLNFPIHDGIPVMLISEGVKR